MLKEFTEKKLPGLEGHCLSPRNPHNPAMITLPTLFLLFLMPDMLLPLIRLALKWRGL
jgi:hypothetical protein